MEFELLIMARNDQLRIIRMLNVIERNLSKQGIANILQEFFLLCWNYFFPVRPPGCQVVRWQSRYLYFIMVGWVVWHMQDQIFKKCIGICGIRQGGTA